MSQPTREEVQAFIDALKYGMKVSHKPEFLIALAEGWLKQQCTEKEVMRPTKARIAQAQRVRCLEECDFVSVNMLGKEPYWKCVKCGKEQDDIC